MIEDVTNTLLRKAFAVVDILIHEQIPPRVTHGVVTWDSPIFDTFHDWWTPI